MRRLNLNQQYYRYPESAIPNNDRTVTPTLCPVSLLCVVLAYTLIRFILRFLLKHCVLYPVAIAKSPSG